MPAIVLWFLGPIGRWVAIGLAVLVSIGGIYTKGRIDGRASYKAKVERQINDAIAKGDKGRADALRKLDADGVPDNWFRD
jgi:hypothetical protein